MKFRFLIIALLGALCLSPGALGASRLALPPPAGWTSTLDPQSQLTVMVAPGNGAMVLPIASTPFSGTARQWHEDRWGQLARDLSPAAPLQNAEVGAFLIRTGSFRNTDGTQPWLRLYTVLRDGTGEGLLFVASNEQQFVAHRDAVDRQVRANAFATVTPAAATTPAPATAPKSPATPPSEASKSAVEVAGLYLATTRQLRFNPLGGSGSTDWEVRTEYYLLSRDGQVFRGRDLPSVRGGDLARFDFAAARREAPGNYGAYEIRGAIVRLQFGSSTTAELIEARRIENNALEIRGTKFTRSVPEKPAAPAAAPR